MAKLLISVSCGEKTCGECDFLWDLTHHHTTGRRTTACMAFWAGKKKRPKLIHRKDKVYRCPACLAAERAAKEGKK